jgi:hypothetical protein
MGKAMKLVCLAAAAVSVLALPASSQTVYSVPANSKGNHLTLTVANESQSAAAQNVEVRVVKQGTATSFGQKSLTVKLVNPGKESDVTFSFDVSREARSNAKDTLEFLISDKQGSTWKKSIFVQYTGPTEYRLDQNFPNPFNPTTTIYYQLPIASKVTIKVYDLLGREVKTLVNGTQEAGYQEARFSVAGLASGVYFCRMVAEPLSGRGSFTSVKKMMAMK